MNENGEKDTSHSVKIKEGEHISDTILRAVAVLSNQPILELSPLADSIDPDSLDQLFASSTPPNSLQFRYEGYLVTIESDHVRIREQD